MAEASTHPIPHAETSAALSALLEKVGDKSKDRDALVAGSQYPADLQILGTLNTRAINLHLQGTVTVDHDYLKSSSSKPDEKLLLAFDLAQLKPKARAARLALLEQAFAAETPPELSAELLADVDALLKRLHKTTKVKSRGAVRCQYTLEKGES